MKNFLKKHQKYLLPASILIGFIVDTFTLNRVDQLFDNLVLLFYLFLVAASILLIYSKEKISINHPFATKIHTYLPFVMNYAFGGLFSGLVIFYSRSGAFLTSFPFMLILVTLLIGNEFFHKRYPRLTFQITIFFIALFSYTILITPVIIGKVNTLTFLLGSFISIVLIKLFINLLGLILPKSWHNFKKPLHIKIFSLQKNLLLSKVEISILSTLAVFFILYFFNMIPPIPLSLKQGAVLHNIERTNTGNYIAETEPLPWYLFFKSYNNTLHYQKGKTLYAFSSVFAPTNLTSTIFHEWLYFDKNKDQWITTNRIPINIIGGRDGGYRGFSFRNNLFPGLWRIDIETKNRQVIGRLKFKIDATKPPKEIIQKVY